MWPVRVWSYISAVGKGHLHICDGSINAEAYTKSLEMLPSRQYLFLGMSMHFSTSIFCTHYKNTNPNPDLSHPSYSRLE